MSARNTDLRSPGECEASQEKAPDALGGERGSPSLIVIADKGTPIAPPRPRRLNNEYPREEIWNILERERARTDRTGIGFSLLVFKAPRRAAAGRLEEVAKVLRRRLRRTDVFGWLDRTRIGVVLPATLATDAWKVAEMVCPDLPPSRELPTCDVYYYPTDGLLDGPTRSRRSSQATQEDMPVRAIETLFVQPLPLWKRGVDILGAIVGLGLSSPLLVAAGLSIKLTSPGPVFFRQERIGRGGTPFWLYKFRSMEVDAEAMRAKLQEMNELQGPVFKIKEDPRITRVGRLLRSMSIDELPQLWNVLKGDMSLVGPRPPLHEEVLQYELWHRHRLEVTPGLTCIWQVSGRSLITFMDWMRMDSQYMRSISPLKDLILVLRTVPAVLTRKGAS